MLISTPRVGFHYKLNLIWIEKNTFAVKKKKKEMCKQSILKLINCNNNKKRLKKKGQQEIMF